MILREKPLCLCNIWVSPAHQEQGSSDSNPLMVTPLLSLSLKSAELRDSLLGNRILATMTDAMSFSLSKRVAVSQVLSQSLTFPAAMVETLLCWATSEGELERRLTNKPSRAKLVSINIRSPASNHASEFRKTCAAETLDALQLPPCHQLNNLTTNKPSKLGPLGFV